jgi:wobble nucleotide-excising tRNase
MVRSTQEEANDIMLMLEKRMEKVCEWSERVEAQTSATAECNVTIWKRRLANCKESLKRKVAALTKADKGQAQL